MRISDWSSDVCSSDLSRLSRGTDTGEGKTGIVVPWFAVLFIAVAGFNSLQLLPAAAVDALVQLDTVLLAMAMAALGLRTHVGAILQAGLEPLLLASLLFVFLSVGGHAFRSEDRRVGTRCFRTCTPRGLPGH